MSAATNGATPCLMVLDLNASCRWYQDQLGFEILSQHEQWALMGFGEARLELYTRTVHESDQMGLTGHVRIAHENVDVIDTTDLTVVWGPETFGYGLRELAVLDCNGYRLVFSQPI